MWLTAAATGDAAAFTNLYDKRVASVYRYALQMLRSVPDAEDIAQDEATLDGRTGVALGRTEPARGSQSRDEIIIDPATGLLIGERTVTLVDLEDIPAGTTIRWSSIETSVVDVTP